MRLLFSLFFILTPIIEIALIIKVGEWLGVMPTVFLLFGTAIVGVSLLRRQGFSTLLRANQKIEQGELPANEIVEGMLLAVGGVMLIVPGFFTDFLGLFCLIPFTRRLIAKRALKSGVFVQGPGGATFSSTSFQYRGQQGDDAIDGEFTRDDQDQIEKK